MSDETTPAPTPSIRPKAVPAPAAEFLTVEEWQAKKKTHDEQHRPAVACNQWPEGKVLSEADYDAGIAKAMGVRLGFDPTPLKHRGA